MRPSSVFVITDFGNTEIEHIYPQRAQPQHVDETMERLKDHIGNLTFFSPSDNRCASNAPFAEKKPHFAVSGIRLNQALASNSDWDPWEEVSLNQRENELLNLGVNVFFGWAG